MMMKRTTVLATAIAAMALLHTPAAQAEEVLPASADPDGNLHAYYGYDYADYCGGWRGPSDHWGSCRNETSSLWNNGYPGDLDDVRVYWGTNQTGASRGVHNGVALPDLRKWTFDAGTGSGAGEALNNNISSHRWVNL